MRTAIAQSQEGLFDPDILALDANLGVVVTAYETAAPDRRMTLSRMAMDLGKIIAPPRLPEDGESDDTPLGIHEAELNTASVAAIEEGLYIPKDDERTRSAKQLVTVSNEESILDLDGVVPYSTGVVFPADEFGIVAHNARYFGMHLHAENKGRDADAATAEERREIEARAERAAGHALEGKIQRISTYDRYLADLRKPLVKIYRDCWPKDKGHHYAHYKPANLDRDRKETDEMVHHMADVATVNTNLGTTAVKAMHRAITYNLYRRSSSNEINFMWRAYIVTMGRYINARRGKAYQSRIACEKQLTFYAPALEAARAEAADD